MIITMSYFLRNSHQCVTSQASVYIELGIQHNKRGGIYHLRYGRTASVLRGF
jgi:hypothetical protein